ncbi:MAG TPA: PepSY-associated TM helix domain-containing protein [Cyclobacteriaceae bacterium]|nr:PepSY-associated TM helix domain-containing protein [Cyclobacteriaceae bacterium]
MKTFWRSIHLYLSLAAGLVIMVICFTGATLVFEKEFQQTIYPDRYYVMPADHRLPLESVINQFESRMAGTTVSGIKLYGDVARTLEVSYIDKDPSRAIAGTDGKVKSERGKRREGPRNKMAFINPYNGDLIGMHEGRSGFFSTMFSLHRWLLMGDIGKLLVGVSTTIFLFIIITGLVLWWPGTRDKLKQHLTYKWAGWKRINHDLHIVTGFYVAIFLFAFGFTGLAWSFKWFNDGIYLITGTENKRPEPPVSVYRANAGSKSFDEIYSAITKEVPGAEYYQISRPKDSLSAFVVTVMPGNAVHERASDQYFVDQYRGRIIGTGLYRDRNLGQQVRSIFYPIHVGSIGGLPGRIIAFFSCIAGVTFPITGLIMWINRLTKKRKKLRRKQGVEKSVSDTGFVSRRKKSSLPV